MKTPIFILLSSVVFMSCTPKGSDSTSAKPQPPSTNERFQKVKVSDIESIIGVTFKNFDAYFEKQLFKHLSLRQQLHQVKLPKQQLETPLAVKLLSETKAESLKIADKLLNLNSMFQEFGHELGNTDKVCKEGYLRFFDGESFTYVVIEGPKEGCTEAMERSKDKIQLINDRIVYLNMEWSQLLMLSTHMSDSISNDLLMPLKVAAAAGNKPSSVYVAFPSDVETSLEFIRRVDSQFDQTLFEIDVLNRKASLNVTGKNSTSSLVKASLDAIQAFRNLTPSESAMKILDTREKYLNGLLNFLSTSDSR